MSDDEAYMALVLRNGGGRNHSVKKNLIATAIVAALASPAIADDIDLIKGKMKHEYGLTLQVLALKNNTPRVLREVWAECGFFQADELVGKGLAAFRNVLPGQTAYDEAGTTNANVTRSDCRIESAD
jgi:hypothetical protein